MKRSIRLLMFAPLASLLATAPLAAQDDDWFDDQPMIEVEEHLQDLKDLLAYDSGPNTEWVNTPCEDEENCEIHIIVDDGERTVIVNGDTVSDNGSFFPNRGSLGYRFGPWMGRRWRGPRIDLDRSFVIDKLPFADPELRKLEREARSIARKARRAESAERAGLEEELDAKLNEIFDYKLERQKKDIDRLEEHLAEMKEHQSKRESARDEIVRNRRDELLGTERYLEW